MNRSFLLEAWRNAYGTRGTIVEVFTVFAMAFLLVALRDNPLGLVVPVVVLVHRVTTYVEFLRQSSALLRLVNAHGLEKTSVFLHWKNWRLFCELDPGGEEATTPMEEFILRNARAVARV